MKEQEEAEEEEQMKERFSFSAISNTTTALLPPPQATLISQKSLSFSNLLDATDFSMLSTILSENHNSTNYQNTTETLFNSQNMDPETPQNFYNNSTHINNSTCFIQKNPSVISHMDENMMYPPKKHHSSSCHFPNTTLQNQNPQWNFIFKQPHINHQLLPGPQNLQFQ